MLDLSKVFKNADKNKINATDYEELITYLAEEQAKSMQKVEEKTEENVETTEENVKNVETTEETSTETTEEVVE